MKYKEIILNGRKIISKESDNITRSFIILKGEI